MKTWVKLENGKFTWLTRLATIEKETRKETPTVKSDTSGTTGDRKTMINTMKMKTTVINSVFLIPSWIELVKSLLRTSAPVT